MCLPLTQLYPILQAFFVGNYTYTVYGYMSNAIKRIDLHDDGKKVTLHRSDNSPWSGKNVVVDIKDITKLENEKALVETYEEASLYPFEVNGKRFYVHGAG